MNIATTQRQACAQMQQPEPDMDGPSANPAIADGVDVLSVDG